MWALQLLPRQTTACTFSSLLCFSFQTSKLFLLLFLFNSSEAVCQGVDTTSTESSRPLLLTFLGCMLVGTCLACFLRPQTDLSRQMETSIKKSTAVDFMNSTFGILLDKKMLLLLPLLVYSGLQQAFIWYFNFPQIEGFIQHNLISSYQPKSLAKLVICFWWVQGRFHWVYCDTSVWGVFDWWSYGRIWCCRCRSKFSLIKFCWELAIYKSVGLLHMFCFSFFYWLVSFEVCRCPSTVKS